MNLIQFIFIAMLMLGNKYSDVVDRHCQQLMPITAPAFLYNMHQNQGFLTSCDIYQNEIGTILKQNFHRIQYPHDLSNINPFCPICLRLVESQTPFLSYFSTIFGKLFLAHEICLKKEDNNCLNTILQEITHAKLSYVNSINETRSFSIGQKEHYIQINISHPLTSHSFFTLKSKIQTNGSTLIWNFKKYHQPSEYFPNIVLFPYLDFEVTVSFTKLTSRDNRTKHKAYVNLNKIRLQNEKLVKIGTDQFDLVIRVITDSKLKQRLIDEMNYKYKHPLNNSMPIFQLIKLQVKLPADQSDEDDQYICSRENSSITELLNQNTSECSTIKSTSIYEKEEQKMGFVNDALSERSFEKEKVDLPRLISSQKLGEYVKSNTQSRIFQIYLAQVGVHQINDILKALSAEFCELVTHEYANYSMQKLFTLCDSQQRMFILSKMITYIPTIVINKQGTHTLQSFIALLTCEEEFLSVINSVKTQFFDLSEHPNATHFIQKIINIFPFELVHVFYELVNQYFLKFSLSKNAMCVLKQMMRRVKQLSDLSYIKQTQGIDQIKKHFINSVTFNIDRIIQDGYGNYIVQFCYQLYGQQRCLGITEMIMERFPQFAIQKYSGNVLFKCIDMYWTNRETIERLKYSLSNNSILDMYRNKDGNKILLTIMEKFENTSIRQKIYGQLITAQPSKFLHDRWGVTMGCRSGMVGTNLKSFPEAVKQSPPSNNNRRKKPANIIH